MSLYEVLNLFPRWPLVFRSFLHPLLIARDVVTPEEFFNMFSDLIILVFETRRKKNFFGLLEVVWQREFTLL